MADTLRVLIVEDVPTDAELMEYELQKPGWSFRHAQKMEAIATWQAVLPITFRLSGNDSKERVERWKIM